MANAAPVQVPQRRNGELPATADQRVTLHHVPWSHYEAELAVRGEKSVPRISIPRNAPVPRTSLAAPLGSATASTHTCAKHHGEQERRGTRRG